MNKEMSGRGGGGVVDGERCGGLVWVYGRRKRNRVSDERERERGNEVELEIFILLKGIIVISHKRWGGSGSPLPPPSSASVLDPPVCGKSYSS
jgi:hypothetical protein